MMHSLMRTKTKRDLFDDTLTSLINEGTCLLFIQIFPLLEQIPYFMFNNLWQKSPLLVDFIYLVIL